MSDWRWPPRWYATRCLTRGPVHATAHPYLRAGRGIRSAREILAGRRALEAQAAASAAAVNATPGGGIMPTTGRSGA